MMESFLFREQQDHSFTEKYSLGQIYKWHADNYWYIERRNNE